MFCKFFTHRITNAFEQGHLKRRPGTLDRLLGVVILFNYDSYLYPYSAQKDLPLNLWLFHDFSAFFPKNGTPWPLIFLVSTIREVIWPSPGTLLAKAEREWKKEREREREKEKRA